MSKQIAIERLRKVLTSDKINNSGYRIAELLKSDFVGILNNYMEVERLELNIRYDELGKCHIAVNAISDKIKDFNIMP